MGDVFFAVGMVALWIIALGVTLALMPNDEDEQDAVSAKDCARNKGRS